MNKKFSEFTALAEGRSSIYKFFSIVYSRPSKDFVDKIKDKKFLSVFSDAELFKAVENTDLEGFEVEYTRLFVASGKHYVPPYESVYKDRSADSLPKAKAVKGMLWGDSTARALEKYRKAGMDISEADKEIPDHISVELEFMHHLCAKESEAWRTGDRDGAVKYLKAESEFLNEHMAAWIGEFCSKVGEHAQNGFYRSIAKLTKDYVRLEHAEIESFIKTAFQ